MKSWSKVEEASSRIRTGRPTSNRRRARWNPAGESVAISTVPPTLTGTSGIERAVSPTRMAAPPRARHRLAEQLNRAATGDGDPVKPLPVHEGDEGVDVIPGEAGEEGRRG